MEFPMVKTPAAKTNGHTVSALKPAVPKKAAATKKAAAKPAPKALAKAAVKAAAKPAAKTAVKTAAKPVAKPVPKAVAKPAAKPATAPAAKPARKAAAKPAAQAVPAPVAKPVAAPEAEAGRDKVRKAKLVRDSFTMPEQEYAVLGQVKKACIKAGFEIKKSELLRIGVALISQLDMATLQNVLASLPQLKTGRPKND
jgi:hypothetical protein